LGTAPRSITPKEQAPGPGNYSPSPEKPKFNIVMATSIRRSLNEKSDTPGPGAYAFDLSTNKGPKYGMIPRRDDGIHERKDRTSPGPGAYDPSVDPIKIKNPKVGMGLGIREGPCKPEDGPGPAAYDTRGRIRGPKWGFGSSKRNRSDQKQVAEPGPGAYNIPPKFADAPKYALAGAKLKISLS